MAAEIKVNKIKQQSEANSMEARDASGNHAIDGKLLSPGNINYSPVPKRISYDTRDEETNAN